jgi:hypothetical protein
MDMRRKGSRRPTSPGRRLLAGSTRPTHKGPMDAGGARRSRQHGSPLGRTAGRTGSVGVGGVDGTVGRTSTERSAHEGDRAHGSRTTPTAGATAPVRASASSRSTSTVPEPLLLSADGVPARAPAVGSPYDVKAMHSSRLATDARVCHGPDAPARQGQLVSRSGGPMVPLHQWDMVTSAGRGGRDRHRGDGEARRPCFRGDESGA